MRSIIVGESSAASASAHVGSAWYPWSVLRTTAATGCIAGFLLFLCPQTACAYNDVPPQAWYARAVGIFADLGYLDDSQGGFRPGEIATRAEVIKLIVLLNGGILEETPAVPHFTDVSVHDWFFPFIEEAYREGWVHGDGDCIAGGLCTVRPHAPIVRAEAAALIARSFALGDGEAPLFADVTVDSWYGDAIRKAARHCILRGDRGTLNVRPGGLLTRAEMVVMLFRIDERRTYPSCE